jgi:hypothetical protein
VREVLHAVVDDAAYKNKMVAAVVVAAVIVMV